MIRKKNGDCESRYDYFQVPQGFGALVFSKLGLKCLILPQPEKKDLDHLIQEKFPGCEHNDAQRPSLAEALSDYFRGRKLDLSDLDSELDLDGFSDFELAVFAACRLVPYGSVCSYREIAGSIGRPLAWRAVGNALSKNEIPVIIPCHRVVKSSNGIGGFSAGPGWKEKLLRLEGVAQESDRVEQPTREMRGTFNFSDLEGRR